MYKIKFPVIAELSIVSMSLELTDDKFEESLKDYILQALIDWEMHCNEFEKIRTHVKEHDYKWRLLDNGVDIIGTFESLKSINGIEDRTLLKQVRATIVEELNRKDAIIDSATKRLKQLEAELVEVDKKLME